MSDGYKNHPLVLLFLSLLGAEVTGFVFVVVHSASLPATDMAHGQPAFGDSLVFPVMSMIALACGLLVFPVALLTLRRVDLVYSSCLIILVSVVVIIGVTPFYSIMAIPCALVAVGWAMLFCRMKFSMG